MFTHISKRNTQTQKCKTVWNKGLIPKHRKKEFEDFNLLGCKMKNKQAEQMSISLKYDYQKLKYKQ